MLAVQRVTLRGLDLAGFLIVLLVGSRLACVRFELGVLTKLLTNILSLLWSFVGHSAVLHDGSDDSAIADVECLWSHFLLQPDPTIAVGVAERRQFVHGREQLVTRVV